VRPDRLVSRYPRLYHMAHDGAWPSIAEHGLLSTTALLDLFGTNGTERHAIESEWRPNSVGIQSVALGRAVIRDQRPLRPDLLARCLTDGMTTQAWYELLNKRVFFWLTEANLDVLLHARAYRDQPQTVVVVDTASLIQHHEARVELSSINSGSILRGGAPRGLQTFKSIEAHTSSRIVELAVSTSVPDIAELVVRVERRHPAGNTELLFSR
jgi:hypothetical protein